MLILKRLPKETITLETSDGTITILYHRRRGSKCFIGIEAPKRVAIHRDDVKHKYRKQEAACEGEE